MEAPRNSLLVPREMIPHMAPRKLGLLMARPDTSPLMAPQEQDPHMAPRKLGLLMARRSMSRLMTLSPRTALDRLRTRHHMGQSPRMDRNRLHMEVARHHLRTVTTTLRTEVHQNRLHTEVHRHRTVTTLRMVLDLFLTAILRMGSTRPHQLPHPIISIATFVLDMMRSLRNALISCHATAAILWTVSSTNGPSGSMQEAALALCSVSEVSGSPTTSVAHLVMDPRSNPRYTCLLGAACTNMMPSGALGQNGLLARASQTKVPARVKLNR